MDADDWSLPDRLAREVELLESRPEVVLVGGSFDVVDATGVVVRTEPGLPGADDVRRELFVRNPFAHGSVMMRADALRAAGGYTLDQPAAEDYDLWCRLAEIGDLANVAAVVYRWRANPGGVTLSDPERQGRSAARVRDALWARARPRVLDRHELRTRSAGYAIVPELGELLVDRFQQVQLALVVELARRGRRHDALTQLFAFVGHRPSAAVAVVVYFLSGRRFTSARLLLTRIRRRVRARARR